MPANIINLKSSDKVECICDNCSDKFERIVFYIKKSRDRYEERDLCKKCIYKITHSTYDLNPMRGKKHKQSTKDKMSKVRTGKLGTKATAWKGGKNSLNQRLKRLLATRYNWFKRVYERDKSTCQECEATKCRLDAHHIKAFSVILKELLLICPAFGNDEEKLEWLINRPEIADHNLENGITLCRKCHKGKHKNWGSHKIK